MPKKKKNPKVKKSLCIVVLYVLCLAGIFFAPIRNVNTTLQMGMSGVEDGTEVQLIAEVDGDSIVAAEEPVYQGQVDFALNPDYFDASSFEVKINAEGEEITWNRLTIFTGKYDTNVDKIIFEEELQPALVEIGQGQELVISGQIMEDMHTAIYNNYAVKIPLFLFLTAFCLLILIQLSKKQTLCEKIIKNLIICIAALIAVYIVFYNDLNKDYEAQTIGMPQASVQDTEQKFDMKHTVRQTFDSELKNLHAISINFQIDGQEAVDENAKFGVSIWETDTGNTLSRNIFSYSSLQQSPVITVELEEKNIEQNKNITVEIKHLSGEIPDSVRILTASGEIKEGQNLYYNGAAVDGSMLTMSASYEEYRARDLAKAVELFIAALVIFTIYSSKLPFKRGYAIAFIYACMLVYSVVQIGYYMIYVGHTPDEMRHISYIVYLEESGKLIPEFSNMRFLTDTNPASFVPNSVNQLGHPPLYYHIMRLCNPIDNLGNGEYYIHLLRLRVFSACFGILALVIVFYLGYRKITKKLPVLHLLYSAIIVSIPMSLYNLSGVNNDTFVLLGCSIFFWGFLNLSEGKEKYGTYWLIALGFAFTILSKLTAGLILILMSSIYIIWHCTKEKSVKLILCRQFLSTLLIYLITIAYFLMVYNQVHSFQPSLANIDMEYYQKTAFYVAFEDRMAMGLKDYFFYYWDEFFKTWTGIASHIGLLKQTSWLSYDRFFAIIVTFLPIFCFFIKNDKTYIKMFISFYASLVFVVIMQFWNAYNGFYFVSGYPGAYQSRYYLCVLPMLAFIAVWLLEYLYTAAKEKLGALNDNSKAFQNVSKAITVVGITASSFLLYSGFLYFILNYSNLS